MPYAWFLPFRCRSSVAVSPFYRCKIPLFYKNYVRKFRSVTAVNGKKIHNGSGNGNGVRKRQRLTGTAKRQRKNGNGMVETRHYSTKYVFAQIELTVFRRVQAYVMRKNVASGSGLFSIHGNRRQSLLTNNVPVATFNKNSTSPPSADMRCGRPSLPSVSCSGADTKFRPNNGAVGAGSSCA